MSSKLHSVLMVGSVLLATIGFMSSNKSIVKADTVDSTISQSDSNDDVDYTVPSKYQSLDKYVQVKNNKFVLNLPQNIDMNEQLIKDAKSQLDIANQSVKKEHLLIDPETKTATKITESASPFLILARRPSNQNITYAWGVRSIFRSNAAVQTRVNIYYKVFWGALAVSDVSGTAGMVGFPWASIAGTASSAVVSDRAKTWADRLANYNRKHKKSKIYQDINWALQDSLGIWHD